MKINQRLFAGLIFGGAALVGCGSSDAPSPRPSQPDASTIPSGMPNDLATTPPAADLSVASVDMAMPMAGDLAGAPMDAAGGGGSGGGAVDLANGCKYPDGPYGKTKDSTLDPALAWDCFAPGSGTAQKVALKDLIDCDGTRGYNAFVFDTSAVWCGPCNDESKNLPDVWNKKWKNDHIIPVIFIGQDGNRSPATVDTAKTWRDKYKLDFAFVCAAPKAEFISGGWPMNQVIDPRNMKYVESLAGYAEEGDTDPQAQAFYKALNDTVMRNKK